jgi:hypothetical protein
MNRELKPFFEPDETFEAPLLQGEPLRETFAELQDNLVAETIGATETLALHGPVKQAANEAAGLAWTTAFPLLVFPTLFNEKIERVRQQDERARRIKAKTRGMVLEAVV